MPGTRSFQSVRTAKENSGGVAVFSTCPQSSDSHRGSYLERIQEAGRWSEEAGCEGMLVYTDNSLVDPWLVAQRVIESTERLAPLVAIQPVYMHPYAIAKMVTSLAELHGRRTWLNLLAGGFPNDLLALGDQTPHDDRYARTVEYGEIVLDLLRGKQPVTHDGAYYRVRALALKPPLDAGLMPGVMVSGSSPAGRAAAAALDAVPVTYPGPPDEAPEEARPCGMRIGIVARANAREAWKVALERFPEDRAGQITHRLAMGVSDSHWHRQLAEGEDAAGRPELDSEEPHPYWLGPFHNYKTFCPYLVGSYERVAAELAAYHARGAHTFVLDIPASREELDHVRAAFAAASLPLRP